MLQYRLFRPSWFSLSRAACPACGGGMLVTSIEPDRPGYDRRIFECAPCELSIAETFATDRLAAQPQPKRRRSNRSGKGSPAIRQSVRCLLNRTDTVWCVCPQTRFDLDLPIPRGPGFRPRLRSRSGRQPARSAHAYSKNRRDICEPDEGGIASVDQIVALALSRLFIFSKVLSIALRGSPAL